MLLPGRKTCTGVAPVFSMLSDRACICGFVWKPVAQFATDNEVPGREVHHEEA